MLDLNFKKFLESFGPGSMLPTNWTGSEADPTATFGGHPVFLPGTDFVAGNNGIGIPEITKKGRVKFFVFKKNPISIQLEDGTKLFLTLDQYKRIQGDLPIIPKHTEITVTFQRIPSDRTLNTSQVSKCVSKFIGPEYLRKHYRIGYTYKP
jgi:hypothetical protein